MNEQDHVDAITFACDVALKRQSAFTPKIMTQMQLHEWVRDNLPIGDAIRKLKSYSRDSHIPLFHPQILLKFDHFLDDSCTH